MVVRVNFSYVFSPFFLKNNMFVVTDMASNFLMRMCALHIMELIVFFSFVFQCHIWFVRSENRRVYKFQ